MWRLTVIQVSSAVSCWSVKLCLTAAAKQVCAEMTDCWLFSESGCSELRMAATLQIPGGPLSLRPIWSIYWVPGWPGYTAGPCFKTKLLTITEIIVISRIFLILAELTTNSAQSAVCQVWSTWRTSLYRRSGCIPIYPRRICLKKLRQLSVNTAATGL